MFMKLPFPIRFPRLAVIMPGIKVNNHATGDPAQISFTWQVSTRANYSRITASIQINGTEVYSTTVPVTNGGTGPQNVALSAVASTGGQAVQFGLNTVTLHVYGDNDTAIQSSVSASFVINKLFATVTSPLAAEQPVQLSWRLYRIQPQQDPDPSAISAKLALNGTIIYQSPSNVPFNYNRYNPDSSNALLFGIFGDSGLQHITVPVLDPTTQPGLSLDYNNPQITLQLTANVIDLNPASVYPVPPGPYTETWQPIVNIILPVWPVQFNQTDPMDTSGARWMTTQVTVNADGSVVGQTTIGDANWLTGYHGGVVVVFYDQDGNLVYHTQVRNYGINGTAFGPPSITNYWTDYIPNPLQNIVRYAKIHHDWDPSDATTNIENWLKVIGDISKIVQPYIVPTTSSKSSSSSGS